MSFHLVASSEDSVDHELIWSSVAGLCVLLGIMLLLVPSQIAAAGACPFKALTGIPCLSFGMTRAFLALLRGDVAGSFAMNPMFAAVYLLAGAYALYGAVAVAFGLRRVRVRVTSRRVAIGLRIAVPVVAAANWAYLIWAGV